MHCLGADFVSEDADGEEGEEAHKAVTAMLVARHQNRRSLTNVASNHVMDSVRLGPGAKKIATKHGSKTAAWTPQTISSVVWCPTRDSIALATRMATKASADKVAMRKELAKGTWVEGKCTYKLGRPLLPRS